MTLTPVRIFLSRISSFLTILLGRWHWQRPAWLSWLGQQQAKFWRYLRADWKRLGASALILVALVGGLVWYVKRPVPHYVTFVVTTPALTEYDEKGISKIYPLTVVFSEAAAPLSLVEKRVTTGIEISPAIAGTWSWATDRNLRFAPKDDWPIDGAFRVRFAKKGFVTGGVQLDQYSFDFRTAPFSAQLAESQFYQDPVDPNLKKVVATVRFSHPVDAAQFEQRISFAVPKDAEYLGLKPDSRNFTLVYDKFRLAAHIHSAALGMPRDDVPMTVRIDKGIRAMRGGNETRNRLEAVVNVPGRTSLKFSGGRVTVVDNARYEPEQIFLFTSSSPVVEKAFGGRVSAYVLPVRHPNQPKEDPEPFHWDDSSQVGNDITAKSQPLSLTYVASDEGGDTTHGFKLVAPVGRYIYVAVGDGVQGTGGYISGKPYTATAKIEPYPRALKFLGQGALLSLSGDKRVGFLVRDIDKVAVEVGRVLPNQLHHVAPQMSDFSRPYIFEELEDRLVERFTVTRDYSGKAPGKPTYDSIDLGQYLQDKALMRGGLFLLRIRSVQTQPRSGEEEDADRY